MASTDTTNTINEVLDDLQSSHSSTLKRASRFVFSTFRLLLACVLIYSGLVHLQNPYFFLDSILQYQMVGFHVAVAMAVILPPLHLLVGVLLFADTITRIAAAISGTLMVIYLIAICNALARGLEIDCGCFGVGNHSITAFTAIRTGFFLAVAILVFFSSDPFKGCTNVPTTEEE